MGGTPWDATVPPPPPDGVTYSTSFRPSTIIYKSFDTTIADTYTTVSETEKLKKLVMCLVEALPNEHKKVFVEKWKGE